MTVFQSWVKTTVAALMRDIRASYATPHEESQQDWDALELRLAIGLVQSRALECRQIAGAVMIKTPADLQELSRGLLTRSSQLENLGKEMATTWPFQDGAVEPETPGPRLVQ